MILSVKRGFLHAYISSTIVIVVVVVMEIEVVAGTIIVTCDRENANLGL
jgi:hypothetical protein